MTTTEARIQQEINHWWSGKHKIVCERCETQAHDRCMQNFFLANPALGGLECVCKCA